MTSLIRPVMNSSPSSSRKPRSPVRSQACAGLARDARLERRGGRLRVLPIALGHVGPVDPDLADPVRRAALAASPDRRSRSARRPAPARSRPGSGSRRASPRRRGRPRARSGSPAGRPRPPRGGRRHEQCRLGQAVGRKKALGAKPYGAKVAANRSIVSWRTGSAPLKATFQHDRSRPCSCSGRNRWTHRSYAKFGPPAISARKAWIARSHVSGRCTNVAGAISTQSGRDRASAVMFRIRPMS